jgi:hypothetical protein
MTQHTYRTSKRRTTATFLNSVKQMIDHDVDQQINDNCKPLGQLTTVMLVNDIDLVAGLLDQVVDGLDEADPR